MGTQLKNSQPGAGGQGRGKTFPKEMTLKLRSEDEWAVARFEKWGREDWNWDETKRESVKLYFVHRTNIWIQERMALSMCENSGWKSRVPCEKQ